MSTLHHRALPALACITLVAMLAGCGGGGNESGPPDSIQLSDDSVTVQSDSPACVVGLGPTVYVYGGQPPYKLSNTFPAGMTLDKSSVGDSGQGFTIMFHGICMTDTAVMIEDDMGRLARLSVNSVAAPASAPGG